MKFQKKTESAEETQPTSEPRVFYSQAPNLAIQVKKPRVIIDPVSQTRMYEGDKQVQFSPLGAEGFGRYITDDPEIIAVLENHSLVFGPEEYAKRSTPAEMRADLEKAENTRLITQMNALQARIIELELEKAK